MPSKFTLLSRDTALVESPRRLTVALLASVALLIGSAIYMVPQREVAEQEPLDRAAANGEPAIELTRDAGSVVTEIPAAGVMSKEQVRPAVIHDKPHIEPLEHARDVAQATLSADKADVREDNTSDPPLITEQSRQKSLLSDPSMHDFASDGGKDTRFDAAAVNEPLPVPADKQTADLVAAADSLPTESMPATVAIDPYQVDIPEQVPRVARVLLHALRPQVGTAVERAESVNRMIELSARPEFAEATVVVVGNDKLKNVAVVPSFEERKQVRDALVADIAIPLKYRAPEFVRYETLRRQALEVLNQLEQAIVQSPSLLTVQLQDTAEPFITSLQHHKLSHELYLVGQTHAAELQLAQGAAAINRIDDAALLVIAVADRSCTVHHYERDADGEVMERYNRLDSPVQRVVAATGVASCLMRAGRFGAAILWFDSAVDVVRELPTDILQDEAHRYIALTETRYGLGSRANNRIARMKRPYLKTVTSLSVAALLYEQERLTESQIAHRQARLAAHKIDDPRLLAALKPRLRIMPLSRQSAVAGKSSSASSTAIDRVALQSE